MATVYNDRILFIGIPKCAGSSIGGLWDGTAKTAGGGYLQATVPHLTTRGFKIGHYPVSDVQKLTERRWDSWELILATIRNPYERMASQYAFLRKRADMKHEADVRAVWQTFEEFCCDPGYYSCNYLCGRNWEPFGDTYRYWLERGDGRLPDNLRIVRLEDIDRIPELTAPFRTADAEIPRHNSMGGKTAETMRQYTEKAKAAIEDQFRWTFLEYYEYQTLSELRGAEQCQRQQLEYSRDPSHPSKLKPAKTAPA